VAGAWWYDCSVPDGAGEMGIQIGGTNHRGPAIDIACYALPVRLCFAGAGGMHARMRALMRARCPQCCHDHESTAPARGGPTLAAAASLTAAELLPTIASFSRSVVCLNPDCVRARGASK